MAEIREKVDVCIVGAGHAGCEAALACARLGLETVIFTGIGLGVGLAMDAFAVSMSNGLKESKMRFSKVLLIAFMFGLFQGLCDIIKSSILSEIIFLNTFWYFFKLINGPIIFIIWVF